MHDDGFMLSYGNPNNTQALDAAIMLVRQHLVKMSTGKDIGPSAALPVVPCPLKQ